MSTQNHVSLRATKVAAAVGVCDPDPAPAICWGAPAMLPIFTLAVVGASQRTRARLQVAS